MDCEALERANTSLEIGYLMGLDWAKRQGWAGPSLKLENAKGYDFGKP